MAGEWGVSTAINLAHAISTGSIYEALVEGACLGYCIILSSSIHGVRGFPVSWCDVVSITIIIIIIIIHCNIVLHHGPRGSRFVCVLNKKQYP